MRRKALWLIATVTAFAVLAPVTPAFPASPRTIKVQAGAVHPTNEHAPYEYTRFYPDVISVHPGQTIRWQFLGFHSVTFARTGRPSFYRPDEVPGTYAAAEKSVFDSGCGLAGMKPCVLRGGTRFVSSGAPFSGSPFNLRVEAPVGTYRFFCNFHPAMSGMLRVVPRTAAVPTQAQINDLIKAEVRKDSAAADAVYKADQEPVSSVNSDGQRVWRVLLGDSTPDKHVSIVAYLPTTLDIGTGDAVKFAYLDRSVNEIHTVTFPTEAVGGFEPFPHGLGAFGIYFSCDFDDPRSGTKGVPGLWGVVGPPCPASLEFVLAPWMTRTSRAPGDAVLTKATYHDSGILVPRRGPSTFRVLPDTKRALPSTFDAEFPAPGTFAFECNIHVDFMTGNINVS